MTPHINLFVISGSGEPGFPYLVTMRLSRDIEIFVKRREIVVEINHKRVKRFPSSLFVLLRSNGIILQGSRIVMPSALWQATLSNAHEGHQGIVRTKQMVREKV